jgi:hypothetical protein
MTPRTKASGSGFMSGLEISMLNTGMLVRFVAANIHAFKAKMQVGLEGHRTTRHTGRNRLT